MIRKKLCFFFIILRKICWFSKKKYRFLKFVRTTSKFLFCSFLWTNRFLWTDRFFWTPSFKKNFVRSQKRERCLSLVLSKINSSKCISISKNYRQFWPIWFLRFRLNSIHWNIINTRFSGCFAPIFCFNCYEFLFVYIIKQEQKSSRWRLIWIIRKPSVGSCEVPNKICARSVRPFLRLLNIDKQPNTQTGQATYI